MWKPKVERHWRGKGIENNFNIPSYSDNQITPASHPCHIRLRLLCWAAGWSNLVRYFPLTSEGELEWGWPFPS